MEWISNEILFYSGIGVTAAGLLCAVIFLCISRISKHRLDGRLDAEYGKVSEKSNRKGQ